MEIKINREIASYSEAMFLGLSLRQFVCSVCAIGISTALFFLLKDALGTEIVSWICIFSCVPFALTGFMRYHGMTFEVFLLAFIRSEILEPGIFFHEPSNMYLTLFRTQVKPDRKEKNPK